MNYSEPTFRKFRDALLKLGLIEKLSATYQNLKPCIVTTREVRLQIFSLIIERYDTVACND